VRYWLIMPAAGSGTRFGASGPKQYAPLEGRTVIEWALAPFLADRRCARLVVALARDAADWKKVAARLAASGTPAVTTVEGGERRSDSVRRALSSLEGQLSPSDWVLVHDAARPCLDPADLARLLDRLEAHPVGGLLAARVSDTLKRSAQSAESADPTVAETVERPALWRALTPQMFRFGPLCAALDRAHAAGRFPSDEAQALEWLGERPVLVEGGSMNLKVTVAADLALAAAVLRARRG
jgi:2-C-methyl-D-erythritol 4-phosphate cytidylyltransferase